MVAKAHCASHWILMITLPLLISRVAASEREDILKIYGSEEMISLATGYRQPLSQAPATATVITADEIEAMGATTLDEVLEAVPGLHVSTGRAVTSFPIIRGIFSETNAGVLVMFNGIPIERPLTGTATSFQDVLVENIARIEVIRGPGSALYGADALAGVINIITKTASDIDGTEIGARAGSLDTYDGWLLYGGQWAEVDIAFSLMGRTTNGSDRIIEADAQTALDRRFGTQASLAPSSVNTDRDVIDGRLELASGPFKVRGNLVARSTGTGTGFVNALDPEGRFQSERMAAEIVYSDSLLDDLDMEGVLSFQQTRQDPDLTLLPPGTLGVSPSGDFTVFADGVRNDVEFTERQILAELSFLYSGFARHVLRFGVGTYREEIDDVEDKRNFLIGPGGILIPTGIFTTTAALGVPTAQPETDRRVYYGYLQDEWTFAPDWYLTTGLRVDEFSDVGGTVNPRVALVWNTTLHWTTKLLYGRAFRAPSFLEEFTRNNLIAKGNPNLDPETIDSVELSFAYRQPAFRSNLTLYGFWLNDRIKIVGDPLAAPTFLTFKNAGDQEGYGVEFEVGWDVTKDLKLKGHYAFQKTLDEDTDSDVGFAPTHQVYAEANWRFLPDWHLHIDMNSVLDRKRAAGDPRPDIDDYTLVDLYLQRKAIADHMDVSLGVRNLFNTDAREPSTSATSLPFDIPLPERRIFGEAVVRF